MLLLPGCGLDPECRLRQHQQFWVGSENTFYFQAADIFAGSFDHISPTIDKEEPAGFVYIYSVTGMKPSIFVQKTFCRTWVIVISWCKENDPEYRGHRSHRFYPGNFLSVAIDNH